MGRRAFAFLQCSGTLARCVHGQFESISHLGIYARIGGVNGLWTDFHRPDLADFETPDFAKFEDFSGILPDFGRL